MIAKGAIHLAAKSRRAPVGAVRRTRLGKSASVLIAVTTAVALLAAAPSGAQAQAYQSSATVQYRYPVAVPTLPTMFMSWGGDAKPIQVEGKAAIDAWQKCDRKEFSYAMDMLGVALKEMSKRVEFYRQYYVDHPQGPPPPSLTDIDDLTEIFGAALYGTFVDGSVAPDYYVRQVQKTDPPNLQVAIQDANTVASLINFLRLKSWAHCKPPVPPPPPSHAAAPRTSGPDAWVEHIRSALGNHAYVNGQFGGLARTTTFDDGSKLHSGSGLFQGNVGIQFPITPNVFVAPQVGIGVPFSGVTNGTFSTKLQVFGTGEVLLGTTLPIPATSPLPPITIFGGGGGAIGSVNSSSTFPGFSYSSTQTLGGFTVSAGASVPIMDNASLLASFRYLNLGFESFPTPAGNFRQREEAFIGALGVQVMLPTPAPLPAP